jgi:hypothetical protein
VDAIIAQRYAFCYFSNIVGFPHLVPTIVEWDDYLPRFIGRRHDHPHEHLLNFHKCMLERDLVHKDVLIKMFRLYLEEHAHEWCQSLPATSIHSLKEFHVAFKQRYFFDLPYEICCHEFDLLCKGYDSHEEYAYVEELEKDISSDQILEDIVLPSLPITHNEESDEYDVFPLQNTILPYNFMKFLLF